MQSGQCDVSAVEDAVKLSERFVLMRLIGLQPLKRHCASGREGKRVKKPSHSDCLSCLHGLCHPAEMWPMPGIAHAQLMMQSVDMMTDDDTITVWRICMPNMPCHAALLDGQLLYIHAVHVTLSV